MRIVTVVVLTSFALAGLGVALLNAATSSSPLDQAIASPQATGLLVTRVVPDTQASRAGILPGDILVAYGGEPTPDFPALNYAKGNAENEKSVAVKLVRNGEEITIDIAPGRVGILLIAVEKDKGREPLPRASVKGFDFSALADEGDREDWYAMLREGEKCGFGRITARLAGSRLFVFSEEILDPGTGLEHHEIVSVLSSGHPPGPVMTSFRDRMNDWVRIGFAGPLLDGGAGWISVTHGPGSEEAEAAERLVSGVTPIYAMETLAGFMPRRAGSCFRFLPMYEGSGAIGLAGALFCTGKVEITHKEKPVETWRYEWRQIGGATAGTYFVGPDDRVLVGEYGPVRAVRGTKTEVMSGQPEDVRAKALE